MNSIKKYIKIILKLNINTLIFNFKYFKFKDALKLPVLISRNVILKKLQGSVVINAKIEYGLINIGFGEVGIFDKKRSKTIWELSGNVIFNGIANIGHGSKISVGLNGIIQFGSNFRITAESSIVSHKKIVFGDNCLLSWNVLIMDTDFHLIRDVNCHIQNEPREINIGNNVWIGCRCLLLKGISIPSGCVIAANSTITKSYSVSNQIIGGPAGAILKDNVYWEI